MKIDFDTVIHGVDLKTPLKISAENEAPCTLKDVVTQLLVTPLPGDDMTSGLKYRLYVILSLVQAGGPQELATTDVQIIEQRSQALDHMWIHGQVLDILHARKAPENEPLNSVPPLPPPEAVR